MKDDAATIEAVKTAPKKASKLKAIPPKAAEPSKPKIMIFGKAGVGKTFTALDFPLCYFIDAEGGANRSHYTDKLEKSGGTYMGPDQGALDFSAVIEQVQALATEEHAYKTLIIDSYSKLYNAAIANEYERLLAKGAKIEFSVEKKPAAAFSKRLISWLSRLDMNVILVCHEKPLWKGGEQIGDTFDGFDKLDYELDLCMNIVKAGDKRIARITKSRIEGFPDGSTFPWSYAEFANRYGKEVIEKLGKQVILASAEQLAEVRKLIDIVKLPEGQEEKWFKAGNAEGWDEMDADKVSKIITYIRETYISKGDVK